MWETAAKRPARRENLLSKAVLLTDFGPPEVLKLGDITIGDPSPSQIRVAVRFAGVGPTDLAIRSGHLRNVFPASAGAVLGFEAAGVVDAAGSAVTDVSTGDEVAVFLPGLGGYAEVVLADYWVRKPPSVAWADAAALPASGEAAVRVLDLLGVAPGETLLILGGTGSVGIIATQLAVARGIRVVAAVRPDDFAVAESLGAIPVEYGEPLAGAVRSAVGRVDAVLDAARASDLKTAAELAGGAHRVITLTNPSAEQIGATMSGPIPAGIPAALTEAMKQLADGNLVLRHRTVRPLAHAADVHAQLEAGTLRSKALLAV
jgi:NADPH:quinone reductase-like Zn-dependent oxidoreductase